MIIGMATVLIGFSSYHVAKGALIRNTREAVWNLQKQGGENLDDRADVFEDETFQILLSSNIEKLLYYSAEEAARNRIVNEGLPTMIVQNIMLNRYTKYALLKPSSGMIYEYYRSSEKKMSSGQETELLDALDELVDIHHVKRWLNYQGQTFFVRQVVSTNLEEKGLLCFAIDDGFFRFLGNEIPYLNEDRAVIYSGSGDVLHQGESQVLNLSEEEKAQCLSQSDPENQYSFRRDKDTLSVTSIRTQSNGWTLLSAFYYSELLGGIREIIRNIVLIMIVIAFVILLFTGLISRTVTENVVRIEGGMKHFEEGDFAYRIRPASYDEVGLLGLQLNYMAVHINDLIGEVQLREEEKKRLEIETLQAQINPHFLYNTLGSLKWAAFRQGNRELSEHLDALISLLRFTIKKANTMVSVEEEINYVKNYIAIEQMRYGDGFQVEYRIGEETKEVQIPGFVLQPLVENCIIHGLDQTKPGGKITLEAYKACEEICLAVIDNGLGIPEEKMAGLLQPDPEHKTKGLNSIGMRIVNQRLHELYGDAYHMEIHSAPGEGTAVILHIPESGRA